MSKKGKASKGETLPAKRAEATTQSDSERFSNWVAPELSPERQAEIGTIKALVVDRPLRAFMRVEKNGDGWLIAPGDKDKPGSDVLNSVRLYGASGSGSNQFVGNLLTRLMDVVKLTGDKERDSDAMGAAVAMIAAIDPQNEMEATMALQMVAANEAAMGFFSRSRRSEYLEHATAYSNMANKAMRSFALHAEAIAKLRRGGEQVVRHVHVNEGGQAVIARTVNTGGRG